MENTKETEKNGTMKLNFCPYDFNRIDHSSLAYELVFSGDWTWEKVKERTCVGPAITVIENNEKRMPLFIKEADNIRERHYAVTKEKPVMLLGSIFQGGRNGLQMFDDLIRKYYLEHHIQMKDPAESGDGRDLFTGFEEDPGMLVYPARVNRLIAYQNGYQEILFYALPCCPICHNRLPIGWEEAEDFGAVALMAPTGSGKTSLLYSLMHHNWESVSYLSGALKEGELWVSSAHYEDMDSEETGSYEEAEGDNASTTVYRGMQRDSRRMCRDNGKCPDHTNKEFWIPPVFLNVQYNCHTMIIGIYDNAGENLRNLNVIKKPQLRFLLDKMFAQLFLFDPMDLNVNLPEKEESRVKEQIRKCRLLSLEEQGALQSENALEECLAEDLVREAREASDEEFDVRRVMDVYNRQKALLSQNGMQERFQEMYFLGVIIKSDLLEHVERVRTAPQYRNLFNRELNNQLLVSGTLETLEARAEEMIRDLELFGEMDIDLFRRDYGDLKLDQRSGQWVPNPRRNAVSWHCISALGCSTTGNPGVLKGKFAPIHVTEPLAACILKRIRDNHWIQ